MAERDAYLADDNNWRALFRMEPQDDWVVLPTILAVSRVAKLARMPGKPDAWGFEISTLSDKRRTVAFEKDAGGLNRAITARNNLLEAIEMYYLNKSSY